LYVGTQFAVLGVKPPILFLRIFLKVFYNIDPRTSEELIETLEENQVQLQNMMTSKYIAFFLEEISTWQRRLSMVDQVKAKAFFLLCTNGLYID
jgi:hypothetical protein